MVYRRVSFFFFVVFFLFSFLLIGLFDDYATNLSYTAIFIVIKTVHYLHHRR